MIVPILLTACSAATPAKPTASSAATATTISSPATTTPPENTPTPVEPVSLFVSSQLPEGVLDPSALDNVSLTDNPTAALWLGPAAEAPAGERLLSSTWVYALTAPFPTLADSVTLEDLRAYWQGDPADPMADVAYLSAPVPVVNALQSQWGAPDPARVTIADNLPEVEDLWAANAWAIVPFDALTPELKVIAVDGVSPISKSDFDPASAPLTLTFNLVRQDTAESVLSDTDLQTLNEAVTLTNRNPEKMTTLVMTGVTALVRATADKMETNGVLYPAEKIVDWLSNADLTHISNEVSFYQDCPTPDPHSRLLFFCSSPDYIELFDTIGADIIELTGNHNNDSAYVYGVDVVPFSLDLYDQHDMVYYGGGLDLNDAKTPLTLTDHGNKLAFIGCNASGPDYAWATTEHGGAAPCEDYEWMADEISRLKSEGYLPIATFQYYEDYYNFPNEGHIRDFGMMADAGAVIVNGSQAHLAKGMTFRDDAFIQYGLGNLFFDQMGIIDQYGNQIIETRWEVIQRHTFYDGKYLSTELLTAMLEDYAQPRPMTETERGVFLESLFEASGWETR
jgi:hypothetical protein